LVRALPEHLVRPQAERRAQPSNSYSGFDGEA
jgi:hypothetical protein